MFGVLVVPGGLVDDSRAAPCVWAAPPVADTAVPAPAERCGCPLNLTDGSLHTQTTNTRHRVRSCAERWTTI
jgi:hypothetical protein